MEFINRVPKLEASAYGAWLRDTLLDLVERGASANPAVSWFKTHYWQDSVWTYTLVAAALAASKPGFRIGIVARTEVEAAQLYRDVAYWLNAMNVPTRAARHRITIRPENAEAAEPVSGVWFIPYGGGNALRSTSVDLLFVECEPGRRDAPMLYGALNMISESTRVIVFCPQDLKLKVPGVPANCYTQYEHTE